MSVEPSRHAILLLGPPHSGLGLFSRILSAADVTAKNADADRRRTSKNITETTARINHGLGWSGKGLLAPAVLAKEASDLDGWIPQARDAIRADFGESRLIVIGEPSVSLTTDLWREAIEQEGFQVTFAIVVRHPLEVASALGRRTGLDENRGLLTWSSYLLAAEIGSRGHRRLFVSFDDLLARPAGVLDRLERTMGVGLPARADDRLREIVRDPDRDEAPRPWPSNDLDRLPRVARFHDYLVAACRDEPWNVDASRELGGWLDELTDAVGPILDRTGREQAAQARLVAAERDAGRLTRVALEDADRRRKDARRAAEAAQAEAAAVRFRVEQQDEQLAGMAQACEAADARAEALRSQVQLTEAVLGRAREIGARLEHDLASSRSASEAARAELAAARIEAANLQRQLTDLTGDAALARARCGILEAANRSLEAQIATKASEHAEALRTTQRAVDDAQRDAEQARAEITQTQRVMEKLERDQLAWIAEHRRSQEAVAAVHAEMTRIREELSTARAQSQSLARELVQAASRPSSFWTRIRRSIHLTSRG